ncbi:Cytochrome P450 [Pleurostoma richardsiae]|uniref:Cytochrome P450 n=1 Tax=Pleurostoma richardsiae TaxID=41990 RepID=A0AA38VN05_9PEZI|nr:Cytochrome P450 [Pleurostoma richardsiae]
MIVAVALLVSTGIILYRLFLHPLAKVPGPRLAAISNVWQAYQARNGRMLTLAKTLHRMYGHAVRVGPNEVWFDSQEAFKIIYNASSGYEKSDFYLATTLNKATVDSRLRICSPDTLDLLSERDMKRYRLQRRLIGPLYQASHLRRYEPAVDAVLARLVAAIRATAGAEVDLRTWMHIAVVECLGAVCLSWSPGWLKAGSDGGAAEHGQMGWRRKSVFGLFPAAAVAESYSRGFGRAFAAVWGLRYKSPKGFKSFFTGVYRNISKRTAAINSARKQKDHRRDLTADLIQLHLSKPEQFTPLYLHRMAMTNFGAGHETTCSALTAAVAMAASQEAVYARLAAEARVSDATTSPRPDIAAAAAVGSPLSARLPYMYACVREAQRLYPVIGMSLPRRVPGGGMRVHGHFLPEGTTVGCPPAALHRNLEVFGADAEEYRPERWLTGDDEGKDVGEIEEERIRRMERYNLTWGGGVRTCPGRNLGEMIVHKAVAALVREFDIEVVEMPREEEMSYFFLAMLSGIRVRFVPAGRA